MDRDSTAVPCERMDYPDDNDPAFAFFIEFAGRYLRFLVLGPEAFPDF